MNLGYNYIARDFLLRAFDQLGESYEQRGLARMSDHQGITYCVDVAFTLTADPKKAVHLKGYPNFSTYGSDMHVSARIVDSGKIMQVRDGVRVDISRVPTLQELPSFRSKTSLTVYRFEDLRDLVGQNVPELN